MSEPVYCKIVNITRENFVNLHQRNRIYCRVQGSKLDHCLGDIAVGHTRFGLWQRKKVDYYIRTDGIY